MTASRRAVAAAASVLTATWKAEEDLGGGGEGLTGGGGGGGGLGGGGGGGDRGRGPFETVTEVTSMEPYWEPKEVKTSGALVMSVFREDTRVSVSGEVLTYLSSRTIVAFTTTDPAWKLLMITAEVGKTLEPASMVPALTVTKAATSILNWLEKVSLASYVSKLDTESVGNMVVNVMVGSVLSSLLLVMALTRQPTPPVDV